MSDWSANQYLKFADQRTRPARDLALRAADCCRPKTVVDLGCGPGNSTQVLRDVFPDSSILGVDSSPKMVERAREACPDLEFRLGDARALEGSYDLIFSNACLQWIPGHRELLPGLMERLEEGGVLAVQVPNNGDEPLFRLIAEVVAQPRWGLADVPLPPNQILSRREYAEILGECSSAFEIWETRYYHPLPDHRALVEWVKGTRLRPYLEALGEERGAQLEQELAERAKELYPVEKQGGVVLGFCRLFFTARK